MINLDPVTYPIDRLIPGKGRTHKAYMWVMVGGKGSNPAYGYNFRKDRAHHHAEELLENFKDGIVHSYKYGDVS